jgi:hypothetical protein
MRKGKVLEKLIEQIVNFKIILGFNFSLKPIKLIEILSLVISSGHEEMIWETNLPREEGHDHLN